MYSFFNVWKLPYQNRKNGEKGKGQGIECGEWNSCVDSSISMFKKMYLCTTCKIKIKITVASV